MTHHRLIVTLLFTAGAATLLTSCVVPRRPVVYGPGRAVHDQVERNIDRRDDRRDRRQDVREDRRDDRRDRWD